MFIKICSKRLHDYIDVDQQIKKANYPQLEKLKNQLAEQMGQPGWHYSGLPAIISVFCIVVSFAIPQLALWSIIFDLAAIPRHKVFAAITATALLFAGINAITLFLLSKGAISALKVLIGLTLMTTVGAFIYLLAAITDIPYPGVTQVGALISILFAVVSLMSLNSNAFWKMFSYCLHNRVWRKMMFLHTSSDKTRKR